VRLFPRRPVESDAPGRGHGDTHRPRNTAPVAADLGLMLVHRPPLLARDPLPVGCQPSTGPSPAASGTARPMVPEITPHPRLPAASAAPPQPCSLPSRHLDGKAMPFPQPACCFNSQVTLCPLLSSGVLLLSPTQGPHGFPRGERGDLGTKRLCRLGQIGRSFPSPSPAHLLPAAGTPADEDSPLHSTTEPGSFQCLREHCPVIPAPPLREEQKLHPSVSKCVRLRVKSHTSIQQIKTLSEVGKHLELPALTFHFR